MGIGKRKKTDSPALEAKPRIYRVRELVPVIGDVVRETSEINEIEAVSFRKQEHDIVICGDDLMVNRALAGKIEKAAHGDTKAERPHKNAGKHALPHFQPLTRPPLGHTFYETPHKKARKPKT